ncbi:uncharacterized protein ACNLHF_007194 [Anomaloglossus baeobatrachus]
MTWDASCTPGFRRRRRKMAERTGTGYGEQRNPSDRSAPLHPLEIWCFNPCTKKTDIIDHLPETDRQTFYDLLDLLHENENPTGRRPFPYKSTFLDLSMRIEDGRLHTDLYSKPTATNSLLRKRGYPQSVISTAYQRAKNETQQTLNDKRTIKKDQPLCLVTDFNNQWTQVRQIRQRHWTILSSDPQV